MTRMLGMMLPLLLAAALLATGCGAARTGDGSGASATLRVPSIHFDSVDEALKYNPLLTSLHKALNATDLLDELNKAGVVATIVAPTNQAFKALIRDLDVTEEELLDDEKLLTKVLSFHVIPDKALKTDDITDGEIEETILTGQYLTFFKETYLYFLTKVSVRGADPDSKPATVLVPDIEAGRVVMHVIDRVVLPDERKEEIRAHKAHTSH